MNITKGKIPSPLKVVLYGVEGIGKSTFASQFPAPLFIDTEGSTKNLDNASDNSITALASGDFAFDLQYTNTPNAKSFTFNAQYTESGLTVLLGGSEEA